MCRCTRSAGRACSSRRCSARCSTDAPTSPCTRPRIFPSAPADGLDLAAFTERRSPADALVGCTLDDLVDGCHRCNGLRSPPCTTRGGSPRPRVRRTARQHRLATVEGSRRRRDRDGGGGTQILEMTDRIAERLPMEVFVPAVGQGCVAVECRDGDTSTRSRVGGDRPSPDTPCVTDRAGVPGRARQWMHAAGRRPRHGPVGCGRFSPTSMPGHVGTRRRGAVGQTRSKTSNVDLARAAARASQNGTGMTTALTGRRVLVTRERPGELARCSPRAGRSSCTCR